MSTFKKLIAKIKTKMITHRQIIIVWLLAIITVMALVLQLYMSLTELFYKEYNRFAKTEHTPIALINTAQAKEVEAEIKSNDKVATIKQYLESKKSPLANASHTLAEQPNMKLIIAISYAESTYCRAIPKSREGVPNYNCWGVGGAGNMWQFGADINTAVVKFNGFLDLNPRGKKYSQMTPKEMNGIYCQDAKRPGRECLNWDLKVNQIISELKALGL